MPERWLFEGIVIDDHLHVGDAVSEGHFGFVFNGRDDDLGREVAIKILKDGTINQEATAEFLNEGVLLERLIDASNVVDLIGDPNRIGTIRASMTAPDGTVKPFDFHFPYLVLEWMETSLAELLPRRDDLSWSQRLYLVREVAKGIHQMHLKDIYHRDLKSDNVLVHLERRSSTVVKVADLGRSRDIRNPPMAIPQAYWFGRGHLLHAPPECLWGLGSDNSATMFRRFDLYLIGSVLFELATGSSITSIVYPNPHEIVNGALATPVGERPAQYASNANIVRSQFAPAFTMFEEKLPVAIRSEGGRLLRQLCDPRPERREFLGTRSRRPNQPGLNWLLTRLDILIRILESQNGASANGRVAAGSAP